MTKSKQRTIALFLAVSFALSIFLSSPGMAVHAVDTVETLTSWDILSAPASLPAAATGGTQANATLNISGATYTPGPTSGYSGGGIRFTNWDTGSGTKYWYVSLSAKGYKDLKVTAKSKGSSTGPRDFKVEYSVNGKDWNEVSNSSYQNTSDAIAAKVTGLPLPEAANQAENLQIRFIMTSNTSISGKTVASTGVTNVNGVVVTGTPVAVSSQAEAVTVSPGPGAAAVGQAVTMSSATADAVIHYSINGGDSPVFQTYDPNNKPVLTSLPATVVAYASKEGLNDSKKNTFNYTQAATAPVTANPAGGAIKLNSAVALSCETPNAKITYTIDGGAEQTYSNPITITKLPTEIKAKATVTGMTPSAENTFSYTERNQDTYNIYFGQLHSHTTNSDGIGTVADAFAYASKVPGLDFLAVTDHSNSLEDTAGTASLENGSSSAKWLYGKEEAKKITSSSFVGLYAYEMTWSNGTGHINTFNTNGFENRNTAKYKASNGLQAYYDRLNQNPQSISQFNHPGTTFGDFNDFANYSPTTDNQMTLLEVGNGEGAIRSSGYFPSYQYYTRALDKGWHVAPTNNQDNHLGKWGDANTARSVILADSLTEQSLYDAMKNRRVYATEDKNLKIYYTLNNEIMGSILPTKSDKVNLKVNLEDPDGEAIGKVDVIVNGGKVDATQNVTESKKEVDFTLDNNYSYYYIRVTQPDKDTAVTAPVWTGESVRAGISKSESDTTLPIKGEPLNITTSLYNNEKTAMTVKSLTYSVDGQTIHTADLTNIGTVDSLGTKDYSFAYTSVKSGVVNVNVTLNATIDGVDKVFNDVLKLQVADPKTVTKVLIDGTHQNDYVNGYYGGNMTNFTQLAANDSVQVKIETTKITQEMLDNTDLLVVTAPAKTNDIKSGKYSPASFDADFMNLVSKYVNNGGTAILCGLSDYQDGAYTSDYRSCVQINNLLGTIGAKTKINGDEVVDDDNHSGSQSFRLMFTDFNSSSKWLNGIVPNQKYSFYSGCSVAPGGTTEKLVNGHATTYSIYSKKDNPNYNKACIDKGNVCALATEQIGKGRVFVGGTVFLSNFEVKADIDNSTDLQYANRTILTNILDSVKKQLPDTKIADVRKNGKIGDIFSVEGTVTAGTQSPNAFFDTIYVQDETGGINIYPLNGGDASTNIKVGQKVRVVGSLDSYQGDLELRVISYDVTNTAVQPVSPQKATTKEAMDYDTNGGKLLQVKGTVTKVSTQNGVLSSILLRDSSGVDVRVFIDGYIGSSTTSTPVIPKLGDTISAIGLCSNDPDGTRLRVRDRAEVLTATPDVNPPDPSTSSSSQPSVPSTSSSSQPNVPKVITNNSTGAVLDISGVTLPAGVTSVSFSATLKAPTTAEAEAVNRILHADPKMKTIGDAVLFDLKLLDQNGNPITVSGGKMKVKIPIPAGMSGNLHVFYYDSSKAALTDLGAAVENGFIIFETPHFSYYAIAQLAPVNTDIGNTSNPSTGSSAVPLIPLAILGVSSLFVLIIIKKHGVSVKKI